jgi:hypothetical protein
MNPRLHALLLCWHKEAALPTEHENRVLQKEDKVKELDQTGKDQERMLRKYEWNMQDI